jgi:hypothetical protein
VVDASNILEALDVLGCTKKCLKFRVGADSFFVRLFNPIEYLSWNRSSNWLDVPTAATYAVRGGKLDGTKLILAFILIDLTSGVLQC